MVSEWGLDSLGYILREIKVKNIRSDIDCRLYGLIYYFNDIKGNIVKLNVVIFISLYALPVNYVLGSLLLPAGTARLNIYAALLLLRFLNYDFVRSCRCFIQLNSNLLYINIEAPSPSMPC